MAGRETNRIASFKNCGKTKDELRRKRNEVSVELRKQSRDEQLFKKRNIGTADLSKPIPECKDSKDFLHVLTMLSSAEPADWMHGVRQVRVALTNTKIPPIKEIIQAGLLPKLVTFLSSKYAHVRDPETEANGCSLHYEAAWALTNIAAGSSEETMEVVRAGAIPYFIALLQSKDLSVCEQVAWALGNIAGDGATLRDEVIRKRAIDPLVALVTSDKPDSFVRNLSWTFSNLCRIKNPPPDFGQLKRCLPTLTRFLNHHDPEVISDACWAFSYISDGPNDKIQAVLDQGVVPRLIELLSDASLMPPCLRTLGNIVTGTEQQTQSVIDWGGLVKLEPLLRHSKTYVQKEAAWMVSNIAAGSRNQIQALLNLKLITPLLDILRNGEFRAQKEAAWAITNLVKGGAVDQVAAVANAGALEALCGVLTCRDSQVHLVLLDGISAILAAGVKIGQLERACQTIENCGGLELIDRLHGSANEEVYRAALEIREKYFNDEEKENEVPETPDIGVGFTFAAPTSAPTRVKYDF